MEVSGFAGWIPVGRKCNYLVLETHPSHYILLNFPAALPSFGARRVCFKASGPVGFELKYYYIICQVLPSLGAFILCTVYFSFDICHSEFQKLKFRHLNSVPRVIFCQNLSVSIAGMTEIFIKNQDRVF